MSISRDDLSAAQSAALRYIEGTAREADAAAHSYIAGVCERAGYTLRDYSTAVETIRQHARIVLHFHPDRFGNRSACVAESLLSEGVYQNQFETGLSSGSPTGYPGGARDAWERVLFGAAYHGQGVAARERPKYGSLELVCFPDGPAPRFGSCYFLLRGVGIRTSITFMGSEDPRAAQRVGSLAIPHIVMAALLAEIENGGIATPAWPPFRTPTLGVPGITVNRFIDLLKHLPEPRPDPAIGEPGRVLDTGVEAQIHGPVLLNRDVETLVADPAFVGTSIGETLQRIADRYGFQLQWHCGFQLPVHDVPDDFRGPQMPTLARHIAGTNGTLNAAVIGKAAASFHHNPEEWRHWGDYGAVLRLLRQLWHVLVHFGRPIND